MRKLFYFFITKIIVSIAIIAGLIALLEWLGSLSVDAKLITGNSKEIIVAILNSVLAVIAYMLIFEAYEKRKIQELSVSGFAKNAILGFTSGLFLQSLIILVIFLAGGYSIVRINPFSALILPLAFAFQAGFVAEILIVGIVFRLTEEKAGSINTLIVFIILFALLHINVKGATILTVTATAIQAGFMIPAAFIYSRSLWLPVFFHFGWDLAEPGIFGGINPSTSLDHGWFTSNIHGSSVITGGPLGPQDSLQSLILCFLTGTIFLLLAKQKNKLVRLKPVQKFS